MKPSASTWDKAWSLLSPRERRWSLLVLAAIIFGAFSAMMMVGSVFPFLVVLADPAAIHTNRWLVWAYTAFGFSSDYAFLSALGLATLAVILLANGVQFLKVYVISRFFLRRGQTISSRLLSVYLGNAYEAQMARNTGELAKRLTTDITEAVHGFFKPAAEFVAASMTVTFVVGLLLWFNPVITLVGAFLVGGLYGSVYVLTHAGVRRMGKVKTVAAGERQRAIQESLSGFREVRMLDKQDFFMRRFDGAAARIADLDISMAVLSEAPRYVMQAVFFGGVVVLCLLLIDAEALASGRVIADLAPTMGVFAFAGQRLIPEVHALFASIARLKFSGAAIENIHADMSAEMLPGDGREVSRAVTSVGGGGFAGDLVCDPSGGRLRHGAQEGAAVVLDRVSYRYPGERAGGVRDLSFSIASGERLGVIGATGSGKTTLAGVMLGLLSPQSGVMVVDCTVVDGAAADPAPMTSGRTDSVAGREDVACAWRRRAAYVPQDIFLLDATVAENIAFGETAAERDDARVEAAARMACVHDFIVDSLPDGYATVTGERGVRLSGGQRQRIGIARALYRDAAFIVFDEATSALDNLTEREVMAAIDAIPGDRTLVIIAHRLSTIRSCDRILMLDGGSVAALGSWDELMRDSEAFRRFANIAAG